MIKHSHFTYSIEPTIVRNFTPPIETISGEIISPLSEATKGETSSQFVTNSTLRIGNSLLLMPRSGLVTQCGGGVPWGVLL